MWRVAIVVKPGPETSLGKVMRSRGIIGFSPIYATQNDARYYHPDPDVKVIPVVVAE